MNTSEMIVQRVYALKILKYFKKILPQPTPAQKNHQMTKARNEMTKNETEN